MFYEVRRNFQTFGADGLLDRLLGAKGPHPNREDETVELAILNYCLKFPTHGPLRVAQQLVLQGVQVSPGGVRGVWSRHVPLTRPSRLLRHERSVRELTMELSDEQVRMLERFSPEFRVRHIETRHTGDLVAVDTFFVWILKRVGRLYLQSVIDSLSRYAWGCLYSWNLPVTAVHVLNQNVLPHFEILGASISAILSDNGRVFCCRPDRHPYDQFVQLEGIEHRTTRVRRPQNNGFVQRLHRTLLVEHFRIMVREKWYESVAKMQKDLDEYLHAYNHDRTHQGRNMNGKTPHQAVLNGLPKTGQAKKAEIKAA